MIPQKQQKKSISKQPQNNFKRYREDLLDQLEQISKINLFRTVSAQPPHIIQIKRQIKQIKEVIQQQQQQLSTPFPALSKSTANKLEQVKAQYATVFKQRVESLPQYKVDKQEQAQMKQLFDSITYIVKTANFLPLLKDKQSTLLMSDCRSQDFGYQIQMRQYEEYAKQAQKLQINIAKIKQQIKRLDNGSMSQQRSNKEEI